MSVNTDTGLVISAIITDAEFRAMGLFITNVLESGGVIRTADTGQVDWATVLAASGGYEIRRFTDAMQATFPVFIKLAYSRSSATFWVTITIGTGSNGSGTITGILYTSGALQITTAASTFTGFVSAGTNRFALMMAKTANSSNSGGLFCLERTLDGAKAVTSKGVLLMHTHAQASVFNNRLIVFSGTQPIAETQGSVAGGCLPPTAQTTGLHSDGNVAVYPFYFFGIGETTVPGTNIVGCFANDFSANNQYTVSVLGVNQNMVRADTGAHMSIARGGTPGNTVIIPMMRYE